MNFPFGLINGSIRPLPSITLSVTDLTVTRGVGVFESIVVEDKTPLFLGSYLDRFYASAHSMGLNVPTDSSTLSMWLQAVIETNQLQDCVLKLMLAGGESEDGMTPVSCNIIVMASELKRPNPAVYEQGVKLVTMEHLRESPSAKHFNYSSAASQIQHMKAQGGYELLYHHQGLVSEASRSNIFIVKDGVLRTPKADILLGIARQNALQLAKARQLPVQEAPITMGMCLSAQEVFITGSSKRIVPVVQIDDTLIGCGRVGQTTQSLMQDYQALIDAQLNKS